MKNRRYAATLTLFLAVFTAISIAVADSHMDYQWTIEVDGRSESAGKIALQMTSAPNEDGTVDDPITIEIMVAEKSKTKDMQATIENNFRATLGDERYKIKTHGSNRVSIKAKDKVPWFTLELTNNTVQGVSVVLKH